mgnify:CR=1 FL=1
MPWAISKKWPTVRTFLPYGDTQRIRLPFGDTPMSRINYSGFIISITDSYYHFDLYHGQT